MILNNNQKDHQIEKLSIAQELYQGAMRHSQISSECLNMEAIEVKIS